MKAAMRDLARDRAVRPEQLALIYIERLFTAYCLGYGLMISLVPRDRVPANAISDLALSVGLSPRSALSSIFLVPGVLLLWSRFRSAGLWTALFGVGIFEVGLIVAAIHGIGTSTAPVGTMFPPAVAAVLLSLHREARRVRRHQHQHGSSDAGLQTDGTLR